MAGSPGGRGRGLLAAACVLLSLQLALAGASTMSASVLTACGCYPSLCMLALRADRLGCTQAASVRIGAALLEPAADTPESRAMDSPPLLYLLLLPGCVRS